MFSPFLTLFSSILVFLSTLCVRIYSTLTMFTLSSLARGLVALALFALPVTEAAYPNPGACSGDCFAHDPALIKRSSDGKYFRFNTGGKIMIYNSDSLSGPWTYQGAAIPAGSSINLAGKDDLWVSLIAARSASHQHTDGLAISGIEEVKCLRS